MRKLVRRPGPSRRKPLALALGLALGLGASPLFVPEALGFGDVITLPEQAAIAKPPKRGLFGHKGPATTGTLGYGGPAPVPGTPGFGLGYHPGYGYGGDALGTGANGGYPFYGGPGYPAAEPALRRLGPIAPFPYFGGPGGPSAGCPNFYGQAGPLVTDPPVVPIEDQPGGPGTDGFGAYSGMIPYPETTFAPFSSPGGTYNRPGPASSPESNPEPAPTDPVAPPPPPPTDPATPPPPPGASRSFGIEAETVVAADRSKGLKVTRVLPQSEAGKAGLSAGDVIQSINGYATDQPGNLTWIIARLAPEDHLTMSVRTVKDGKVRSIIARRP